MEQTLNDVIKAIALTPAEALDRVVKEEAERIAQRTPAGHRYTVARSGRYEYLRLLN